MYLGVSHIGLSVKLVASLFVYEHSKDCLIGQPNDHITYLLLNESGNYIQHLRARAFRHQGD